MTKHPAPFRIALAAAIRNEPAGASSFVSSRSSAESLFSVDTHGLPEHIRGVRAIDRNGSTSGRVFPSRQAVFTREIAADDDLAQLLVHRRVLSPHNEGLH